MCRICLLQTGSGKTLAYLLPIFAKILPARAAVQAIVVVPTRELGMQVSSSYAQDMDGDLERLLSVKFLLEQLSANCLFAISHLVQP